MCFNAPVSISTFIVGLILNIAVMIRFPRKEVIAVSLCWSYVLLMQLFEAIIWTNQDCGRWNKFASIGAFIANISQPIFVAVCLMATIQSAWYLKLIISILLCGYIIYMATAQYKTIDCTRPSKKCASLEYRWWDLVSAWPYLILLLAAYLLLLRPLSFSVMQVGWILLTLLVAILTRKGAVGSMWCFLAAFAPVLTAAYCLLNKTN